MMFEDPVHCHLPVLEDVFYSHSDFHDLSSFLETELPVHSTSGSETNRLVFSLEERKRRRKISNRESARRSRLRKKNHLENVTEQVDRLKAKNRDLKNRLWLAIHRCQAAQRETDRLRLESFVLQQYLVELHESLNSMQLH
ncbi:hypothetical protein KY290_022512 [Solanum tuberosum]|uniref:BZIP domain-containing protein n=1 Tax=Solanum tuberosum TaxID=4113 RepID=A0ABQ7V4K6_SOLTU|nr:hypothetical protein KY284_021415 [Solanum tuberosum]KAH0759019.1 hypothetical protein KY290_022512 [Solanum tuberosum]